MKKQLRHPNPQASELTLLLTFSRHLQLVWCLRCSENRLLKNDPILVQISVEHTQLILQNPTVSMKLFEKMKNALNKPIFGEVGRCTAKRKTLAKLSPSSTSSALPGAFEHIPAFPWMGVPQQKQFMKRLLPPG